MLEPFLQKYPVYKACELLKRDTHTAGNEGVPRGQHLLEGLECFSAHEPDLERTRFVTMDPVRDHPVLASWMQGRAAAEDRRRHLKAEAYQVLVSEGQASQLIDPALEIPSTSSCRMDLAMEVLECFQAFESEATAALAATTAHPDPRGLLELCSTEHLPLVIEADVDKPETGKMRLELQWSHLSPAWQQAFEKPIINALQIYVEPDALAPVMCEDTVHDSEVLPSRFVSVNKADPKNTHPTDADLELAKLKARLVIAGRRDQ